MEERAARQVYEILASHQPEPLPEDVREVIRAVVLREEERVSE
jgi:trimethylamine:corrinoid methyltransferase-like protein